MYTLKNKHTGQVKTVKDGFSWTSLLFGALTPLFRGDLIGVILQLIAVFLTGGFAWLVIPFIYNKRYRERLIEKGYEIV